MDFPRSVGKHLENNNNLNKIWAKIYKIKKLSSYLPNTIHYNNLNNTKYAQNMIFSIKFSFENKNFIS